MISEDFYAVRHKLENLYNTYSRITLGLIESHDLIARMHDLEERIIALENTVVPQSVRQQAITAQNVVRLDHWKGKRK